MTLQRLEALLVIGSSQDITNKALAQRLGLSPNAANRHVMAALNLGLIETEVWGMDRRQNLLNLTPEGQTLIDRIHGLLRAPDPGLAT
jgi:DNA-binding MarR family transcriptional regulator